MNHHLHVQSALRDAVDFFFFLNVVSILCANYAWIIFIIFM